MEGLAALGLAGNVIQFIQFASGLISTGSDVYNSASGASTRNIELEKIYKRLATFTSSLQSQGTTEDSCLPETRAYPPLAWATENIAHVDALNDLAKDCKELCDELLETISKLRVEGGRWRLFRSFVVALQAVWDSKKIAEMEERLDRFQTVIMLHFFPFLRYPYNLWMIESYRDTDTLYSSQQSSLLRLVGVLRQESYSLRLDQNSKLDSIKTTLSELTSTTQKMNDELSMNQSGIMGPSRAEMSSVENRGIFRQIQTSLLGGSRVDTLYMDISRLALTEQELEGIAREQAVLRTLNFPSRPVRHDNIPVAHEQTCQWMIDPPGEPDGKAGHQFPNWLRDGNGIFWVAGKPGSGKSTLMKFLADHETTRAALEEWADQMKLVIATHYFWSAGTPMQKSHEGLFRTLLYEIFRAHPSLIPEMCPVRWAQTNLARTEKNNDWTISELLGTLQALSTHSKLLVRYCFFIDGIDEFDGDHSKLCEMFKDLSRSPNIKLCLASRPWNVFVDAFGDDPMRKIYIEDLTRNDILRYTESRLMGHQRWTRCNFLAKDKQSIIDDITSKAQGVFLWVFLVTNSLRDGLTNGDTMSDLRKRLESLPTDLERFFKHMLEAVNSVYHEKMASFLSIAVHANQPHHFLIYIMHENEYEDEDYAVNMPVSPFSVGEIDVLHDECRRRVNARCGGLLDVNSGTVEFLHRTVRDFLFTREMSDYISTKTRPGFSAALSTFRAYVATQKRSPHLTETASQNFRMQTLLEESLQCASDALEGSEDLATELLNTLEDLYFGTLGTADDILGWKLVSEWDIGSFDEHTNFCDTSPDFQFREELLRAGVDKYVSRKLHESPNYFDNLNESPLSLVIKQPRWTVRHIRIIHDLLELGQDPNLGHPVQLSASPWACFVLRTCREEYKDDFYNAIDSGLFSKFLHCGANRDMDIDEPHETNCFTRDPYDMASSTPGMPCSYFVQALFSHYSKHPEKALRVLDDFFDISLSTNLDPAVLDTLQKEVQAIDPKATRLEKLKFFANITRTVVKTGVSLGWEMGFLSADIERAFPPSLGSPIIDLVNIKGGGQESRRAPHKRKAGNDWLERVIKRTKGCLAEDRYKYI